VVEEPDEEIDPADEEADESFVANQPVVEEADEEQPRKRRRVVQEAAKKA